MFGCRYTLETIPIQVKLYTTRLQKTIPLSLKFKEFLPYLAKGLKSRTPDIIRGQHLADAVLFILHKHLLHLL
jgi:hypothetical protein